MVTEIVYSTPNNQTCYIHYHCLREEDKSKFISIMNIYRFVKIFYNDKVILFNKKIRIGEESVLEKVEDELKKLCKKNKIKFIRR